MFLLGSSGISSLTVNVGLRMICGQMLSFIRLVGICFSFLYILIFLKCLSDSQTHTLLLFSASFFFLSLPTFISLISFFCFFSRLISYSLHSSIYLSLSLLTSLCPLWSVLLSFPFSIFAFFYISNCIYISVFFFFPIHLSSSFQSTPSFISIDISNLFQYFICSLHLI